MYATLLVFAFIWTNHYAVGYNVTALKQYDRKVCKNEPSCYLLNEGNFPPDRRTLRKRECMCDANCVEYRDCCTDSQYYKESEQNISPPYFCSPTSKVYMKTSCPTTWSDEQTATQCQQSQSPLHSNEVALIIPVTNLESNVTYGNKYCAACHGVETYTFWYIKPQCGEAPAGLIVDSGVGSNVRVTRASDRAYSSHRDREKDDKRTDCVKRNCRSGEANHEDIRKNEIHLGSEAGPDFINALIRYLRRRKRQTRVSVDYNPYDIYASLIWTHARYDPGIGFYVAKYENKDFICEVSAKIPEKLKPNVRTCVPNLIEKCVNEGADPALSEKCKNHTSIVYNKQDNKVYRNKFCATCHNVDLTNLTGCPIVVRQK